MTTFYSYLAIIYGCSTVVISLTLDGSVVTCRATKIKLKTKIIKRYLTPIQKSQKSFIIKLYGLKIQEIK